MGSNLDALGMYVNSAAAPLMAKKSKAFWFPFGCLRLDPSHIQETVGACWRLEHNGKYYADDFDLADRLAQSGLRVELMLKPASMVFSTESLNGYFRHKSLCRSDSVSGTGYD